MRRREFIRILGGAAAWPLVARAQQDGRVRRIGVLLTYAESDSEGQARIAAFRKGLNELGWKEGGNISIDYRWATTDRELIRRFAVELVERRPDLIVAQNTPTTAAILQQ